MPGPNAVQQAVRGVTCLVVAAALVAGMTGVLPDQARAVQGTSPGPQAVPTAASAITTEPFLPYSGSPDAEASLIPGPDGEQYLVLVLAAVFLFLGLGYRMLARTLDAGDPHE